MGKGDKKSKKGKISIGSFGVSRPKKLKNKKARVRNTSLKAETVQKAKKAEKKK